MYTHSHRVIINFPPVAFRRVPISEPYCMLLVRIASKRAWMNLNPTQIRINILKDEIRKYLLHC